MNKEEIIVILFLIKNCRMSVHWAKVLSL